jgi:ketosteroid isomerase-like protein
MSQENVELVRQSFESFTADGFDAALRRFYPEDVTWFPFPDAPENRDGYRGHDGIRDLMNGWYASFDDYSAEADEIRDFGDRVVALGRMSGSIKGSGLSVDQPLAGVFSDFRYGKIGRVSWFPTWAQALEAVGLSE